GDSPLLPKKTEEKVLRTDVAVIELPSLGHRELEHPLGAGRVREVGARGQPRPSLLDYRFDLQLHLVEVHGKVLQHDRRHAPTLSDDAEENVLRADVLVM